MVAIKMSMAMQRFRAEKSPEEKCLLGEATPRNTAYNTKWAGKAFETWQMSRSNKTALQESVGFGGVVLANVQGSSIPIHEMTMYSLHFWLCKHITKVAKQNAQCYPPKSLYLLICGINRHLLDLKGEDGVNILAKSERRLVILKVV